jgi:carbamoyltransferase
MSPTPVVLGINRTADASICLVGGSQSICSIQKERYTRQKHHWGATGDIKNYYLERVAGLREPIDLIVECYSSDREAEKLDEYHRELKEVLRFRGEPRIASMSHHLAHLYSSFFLSPFSEAAVMVMDFQGSRAADFTEAWPGRGQAPPHWVEVSSFYRCGRRGVECIGKQLWDNDRLRPLGLGGFYNYLTHVLFRGRGMEGKVMGLAPYGDPYALGLPPLDVRGHEVFIPEAWCDVFRQRARFNYFKTGDGSFNECADLATAGQLRFEEAQLQLAEWLHRQTGCDALCLTGGTALNCVANGRLLRESPFREVFVSPSPHDGGTALGCALYGMIEILGVRHDFRCVNDFLAPEPDFGGFDALLKTKAEFVTEEPADLIARMVDLLEAGRTVALFRGRSELGPRALGHRSILADPRNPEIRAWINKHVKGRELFRPLAPVALEDAAPTFFEVDRPVPFMQFAVKVRPEYREVIPAVTHVDGTARLQTVNEEEDPFLFALLKAFEARTGVGVLLNTSFNGQGEPIIETPAEALACFESTRLHALAIPPYLILKRPEPGAPEGDEREHARLEELAFVTT